MCVRVLLVSSLDDILKRLLEVRGILTLLVASLPVGGMQACGKVAKWNRMTDPEVITPSRVAASFLRSVPLPGVC